MAVSSAEALQRGSRQWPFVGRQETARGLVRMLTETTAVLLTGDEGMGKSRVLIETYAPAGTAGLDVVALAGVETTARMPLGPLLPLLPRARPGGAVGALAQTALSEVYRRSAASALVIVVDDAHLVADEVAVFVHQVVSCGLARVLLSKRRGETLPAAIDDLCRSGAVVREDLAPLSLDGVVRAVEHVVDGLLEPAAGRDLARVSGGNPPFLRELVLDALESAVLRPDGHGLWYLSAPLRAGQRVQEVVEGRLAHLSPAQRETLAVVALQTPVPFEILTVVTPCESVLALVDRGAVLIEEQGRRQVVRAVHDLHGVAALSGLDPLRRRRLLAELAQAWLASPMRRDGDEAIAAELSISAGLRPDPEALLAAIRTPGVSPTRALELADVATSSVGAGRTTPP